MHMAVGIITKILREILYFIYAILFVRETTLTIVNELCKIKLIQNKMSNYSIMKYLSNERCKIYNLQNTHN